MNKNESMNSFGPLIGAIDEGTSSVRFLVGFNHFQGCMVDYFEEDRFFKHDLVIISFLFIFKRFLMHRNDY